MSVSVAALSAEISRGRSIEARRAARAARFERERLIVDYLNRGVSIAEIAGRIGVTEKRMRALVKEILARRMPAPPAEYAAVQVSRLNEALLVAYSAMSPENLRAVALVVRIVRELDRYHGFAAPGQHARREPRAVEAEALAAPRPADRPEMAPQALENTKSAPENGAVPVAFAVPARAGSQNAVGAGVSGEACEAPVAAPPRSGPAPDAPSFAGPEMAPQATENIEFAPGDGGSPAAGVPRLVAAIADRGGRAQRARLQSASPRAEAFASDLEPPRQASPPSPREPSHETMERPEPVAVVLVPDSSAPGGFRRVKIRFLANGVAAC